MTNRRSAFTTALIAGPLALALVACGSDDSDDSPVAAGSSAPTSTAPEVTPDDDTSSAQPDATPTPDEQTAGAQGGGADTGALLAAARTALAEVDGATLFSIDGETSGWDITLVAADGTQSDVDVSPDGTSVTRGPVTDTDDDADDEAEDLGERQQLLTDARLDYVAAIEAASAAAPGATVTGADLDLDQGLATWDVQLDEDTATEQTITIDAASGDVLSTERDD